MWPANDDEFFTVREFTDHFPTHRFKNHIPNPACEAIAHTRRICADVFILKLQPAVLHLRTGMSALAVFGLKPCIFTTHEVSDLTVVFINISSEIHKLIKI